MHFFAQFDNIVTDYPVFRVSNGLHCMDDLPCMNKITDAVLIKHYVEDGNEDAFQTLLHRHYDVTYKRFLKHCHDPDTAADLTQQLWLQMVKNLDKYQDDGKFPAFLMRSASNLLTDHWRRLGVKDKVIDRTSGNEEIDPIDSAPDIRQDTSKTNEIEEQVEYLTHDLIPTLPCDQRLVFLLKHESEYWEYKKRLDWHHLSRLNNIDQQTAWNSFEQVRNCLMTGKPSSLSCEDQLIFLVWTQAQRPYKNQEYTWAYYAELLNVPENTLKTRYRAALKSLSAGMEKFNGQD